MHPSWYLILGGSLPRFPHANHHAKWQLSCHTPTDKGKSDPILASGNETERHHSAHTAFPWISSSILHRLMLAILRTRTHLQHARDEKNFMCKGTRATLEVAWCYIRIHSCAASGRITCVTPRCICRTSCTQPRASESRSCTEHGCQHNDAITPQFGDPREPPPPPSYHVGSLFRMSRPAAASDMHDAQSFTRSASRPHHTFSSCSRTPDMHAIWTSQATHTAQGNARFTPSAHVTTEYEVVVAKGLSR